MIRSVAARRVAVCLGWLAVALAGSVAVGFLIGLTRPRAVAPADSYDPPGDA